ncbi:MAG: hypothetical protein LBG93_07190 [Treponema sp.]|jgi:hypothetical protein|nr:hypothetical protein [Treponema sp.]
MQQWHKGFFEKLEKTPVDIEDYKQFTSLFNLIFGELDKELGSLVTSASKSDNTKYIKYEEILNDWHSYKQRINRRKKTHFGYQMNLTKRSFLVDFFRIMESFEVIQNNFGDIHDISDIEVSSDPENPRSTGNNYAMDTKSLEWDIVRLVAENLRLPKQPRLVELRQNPERYKDGYWGYVTSGGSESNLWGVIQGFVTYPNGILYYSEGAHYSIGKAASNRNYRVIKQRSADDDAIDESALLEAINSNWTKTKNPAIVLLTSGTTKYGSIDDVAFIKSELTRLNIPHYLHIDAAFYGGIPKNQENAPIIGDIESWGYDSIAVSMHKYIGYPAAKGVLISTKRPSGTFIDYIGQEDNTVLGSRDVPAFSLRQQVMDILHHSHHGEYIKNIRAFSEMLESNGVKFAQWAKDDRLGSVFVFKVDKNAHDYKAICRCWQLSEFSGIDNVHRVHAVIFPFHSQENLQKLSLDISKIALNG